ncbi:MAG: PolC-type DNA polymerase III [Clostridia bacterium]|nr:PolC-type DNA polymerase III [Clostridia bacterium]
MNKQELLRLLEATIPILQGKLQVERVLYKRTINKAYISFFSDVLVAEKDFLSLERKLRSVFPGIAIALRVASPALGRDFLQNIDGYISVLTDFLRRQSPALSAWIHDVGWSVEHGRILLTCPDEISVQYFRRHRLDEKLSQAVWDIFRLKVSVALCVCGQREEWVSEMREQRGLPQDFPQNSATDAYNTSASSDPSPDTPASDRAAAGKGSRNGRSTAGPAHGKTKDAKGPVLKGRAIGDTPVPIAELADDSGIIVIEGTITGVNPPKELKGGETVLCSFTVYDNTGTVFCKAFFPYRAKRGGLDEVSALPTEEERQRLAEQAQQLQNGLRVRIRGVCRADPFLGDLSVTVRDIQQMPKHERLDTSVEKRVELHMHSTMSAMDATTDAGALIAQAAMWGHPAVAITDHGVTQAFPAAFNAAKRHGIKLIPGMEGYLCDIVPVMQDAPTKPFSSPIVVLDFETTGLSTAVDRIVEIGAVKLQGGQVVDELSMLCNPGIPMPAKASKVNGITDLMLRGKESPSEAVAKLLAFIGDCPVAAHNAPFDMGMLQAECKRMKRYFHPAVLDTLVMARRMFPKMHSHRLGAICRVLGVSQKNAHRAVHDAAATAQCLQRMFETLEKQDVRLLSQIEAALGGESMSQSYHIILLAKTQRGMENLNRLISESHLRYFHRHPNLPRRLVEEYREGLLLGSACEAGELFQALVSDKPEADLRRIAAFYDFLEIQPAGNNRFLIKNGHAKDEEQLRDYNRRVVTLGESLAKPVVATGDVHFLTPEDAVYRSILQAGLGYEDPDEQPPLFFKTTGEMLEEFAYLGEAKALEVVVKNPAALAAQVEDLRLFPKHPKDEETFQPFWPEAPESIETMAWAQAAELYGEPLPPLIEARLHKELKSIIGYGFATLYAIAQKLVQKSLDDGYLVGSRGSVGSSFVATLCGITEVNPLPPHYRCSACRTALFTDPSLASVGADLPDALCQTCGAPLIKDGFDIPFEVFLGFEGDKVPDIDLNFSGEYQAKAHRYIEELFGEGYVFRAGTISALAEKTAYGFTAKYLEERGISAGRAHKERLAAGCMGVKRTTGQHPGGIVVLPKDYNINQFTATQHPADDIHGNIITTHYDFRSMHDILVKLDCLGHDDPTMIHRLEELTGCSYKTISLTDPKVMSLFISPKALGVNSEDILCEMGTLGIPEFGTSFVQGMLRDTRPGTMEELIRISGLSHGTDVWLGNARDLIDRGIATLKQCICTRDDIMNSLIAIGVESKLSFDAMESVRKGKGLTPGMETAMREKRVPDWFIESCKKIKYMFPKGHAVAYVTMALRVAWYKVYHPLAYYAAYFSIRADGFDAARMLLSKESLRATLLEMNARDEKLSVKEKQEQNAYHMLLEMQSRGIRMLPVDLYRSDAMRFLPENGDLRCPFTAVSGFGEAAVQGIVEARNPAKPFLSVEDLRLRARLGASTLDMLRQQGALAELPETSQVDLFSLL